MRKKRSKYGECSQIYEYVKRNKDRLPDWWQKKGTRVCIEGICCMIARNKFHDSTIAEFYECPVVIVQHIREAYIKTIANLQKEHEHLEHEFAYLHDEGMHCPDDDRGFVELLCAIFKRCYDED